MLHQFEVVQKNTLIDQIRSFNNADLKDQSATEALRSLYVYLLAS